MARILQKDDACFHIVFAFNTMVIFWNDQFSCAKIHFTWRNSHSIPFLDCLMWHGQGQALWNLNWFIAVILENYINPWHNFPANLSFETVEHYYCLWTMRRVKWGWNFERWNDVQCGHDPNYNLSWSQSYFSIQRWVFRNGNFNFELFD